MKITKTIQRDYLKTKLSTNAGWAKAALLKIYENQTDAEQSCENTTEANGIGFTGCDGQILSSFANQLITKKYLSPKQMEILMKKMKKYWKQILTISDIEVINSNIIKEAA